MIESFKINISTHLRSGWLLILGFLICINVSHTLSFFYPNETHENSIGMGLILFIVFVLPGVVIHISYYLVNRGDVLKYCVQQRKIHFTHQNHTDTFSLDDVSLIERFISFNQAAGRSSVLLWDGYHHSVIYLKNGKIFTITSLLMPDLDFPIEKEKIMLKENFFRLAKIR